MTQPPAWTDARDDGSVSAVEPLFRDPRVMQLAALGSSLWYRAELVSGRVAWTTPLLERWGYDPDDTVRHVSWWLDRTHRDDRGTLAGFLDQARSGDHAQWTLAYRFRKADGDWTHVVGQAMLVRDPFGQPVSTQGAVVDVTQPDRAPESAHTLGHLTEALDRASALVQRLRSLMRGVPFVPTLLDPCDVVRAFTPSATRLIGREIEFDSVAEGHDLVMAEAAQLEQVLRAMLVMAREASGGRGRISLTASPLRLTAPLAYTHGIVPEGDWVRLRVVRGGSGQGEPGSARDRDAHMVSPGDSNDAFGMDQVRRAVAEWSGHVVVSSGAHEGNTISCYLPTVHRMRF